MTHLDEERLVLAHYGEGEDADRAHLEACTECRDALRAVGRDLAAADETVPEPDLAFEDRTWAALQPRLNRRVLAFRPRPWMGWLAAAAALVAAFMGGRYSTTPTPAPVASPQVAEGGGRDRVLLVAVGDHLERSAVLLVELSNATPGTAADLGEARESAQVLLAANRLYRQSAGYAGDAGVEGVLDELGRVLADVAHTTDEGGAADLQRIRRRIEKRELLFKVRVLGTRVREQEQAVVTSAETL